MDALELAHKIEDNYKRTMPSQHSNERVLANAVIDAGGLIKQMRKDIASKAGIELNLRKALKPLADYADPHQRTDPEMVITQGSSMAKRQLTMDDCYQAWAVLI